MYIKPLDEFSTDIIWGNHLRKLEVEKVIKDKKLVSSIFSRLKESLDNIQESSIKDILCYELFFELIPAECISDLLTMYLSLGSSNNKNCCIEALKTSYINKGDRGFLFSFMPIIFSFSCI